MWLNAITGTRLQQVRPPELPRTANDFSLSLAERGLHPAGVLLAQSSEVSSFCIIFLEHYSISLSSGKIRYATQIWGERS